MEKQLNLFDKEVKEEFEVWHNLPDIRKNRIETGFVNLLIKFLCQSNKEAAQK
jgi:hypothetical protein